MNPEQPEDKPSITITIRSTTPESPRPIQPPQAANIPVLQYQNDPLFNLVTSHTTPPFAARNLTAMDHELASTAVANGNGTTTSAESADSETTNVENPTQETAEVEVAGAEMSDNIDQLTDTNQQASAPLESSETISANLLPDAQPVEPSSTANPFTEADPDEDEPKPEQNQPDNVAPEIAGTGVPVNYQALLDQIVASSANAATTAAPNQSTGISNSSQTFPTSNAGLPPRPPPQDQPNIHPNYATDQDIRSFHYPQPQNTTPTTTQNPSFQQGFPNPGLAPPSGLSQPQPSPYQQPPANLQRSPDSQAIRYDDEKRWPLHVQQMYEDFLRQEEIFTKDGAWDKFPPGSRLFVGNLPTEVVTKRDIFHCFFRFGKIAQISIKQAYGFVQFMDRDACTAALNGEQGAKIKDRAMHLEVSKPPKSRTGGGGGGNNNMGGRNDRQRRSRSPENRRPGSAGLGRNNRPGQNYRDEGRRRDDYRPGRSPSPRGFRDRSPGRNRNRSRSPRGRGNRYGRSPSPHRRSFDNDDDGVPFPRRLPRDVPDVQLLLVDELDKPFIDYLEKAFRDRSLRTAVLYLPQVPVQALVKRQIVEGVQGIVKLDRATRNTGRIPIQIFDRTAGAANVRFDEYDNLDASTAAELVVRAKAKEAAAVPQIPPSYNAAGGYPPAVNPQFNIAALQQAVAQQPNLANVISTLDGPALQAVLGALQQPSANAAVPVAAQSAATASGTTDIAALLGSLSRQPQQPAANARSSHSAPSAFGGFGAQSPATQAPYSNFQQGQAQQQQYGQQQYTATTPAANVSSVLDRLGRWKQ